MTATLLLVLISTETAPIGGLVFGKREKPRHKRSNKHGRILAAFRAPAEEVEALADIHAVNRMSKPLSSLGALHEYVGTDRNL